VYQKLLKTGSSISTYRRRRGHVFFGTECINSRSSGKM